MPPLLPSFGTQTPLGKFVRALRDGSTSAALFVASESLEPAAERRPPRHHNTVATQHQAAAVSAVPAVGGSGQQVGCTQRQLGAAARDVIGVRPGVVKATVRGSRARLSSRLTGR